MSAYTKASKTDGNVSQMKVIKHRRLCVLIYDNNAVKPLSGRSQ